MPIRKLNQVEAMALLAVIQEKKIKMQDFKLPLPSAAASSKGALLFTEDLLTYNQSVKGKTHYGREEKSPMNLKWRRDLKTEISSVGPH